MTNEEKQALIEHAKTWIANCEAMRDEIPFGLDSEADNELSLIKIALADLTAQPVKLPKDMDMSINTASHLTYADGWNNRGDCDAQAIRAAGYEVQE